MFRYRTVMLNTFQPVLRGLPVILQEEERFLYACHAVPGIHRLLGKATSGLLRLQKGCQMLSLQVNLRLGSDAELQGRLSFY